MLHYSRDGETASIMALAPVIPVLTVGSVEDGLAQAKALVAGGLYAIDDAGKKVNGRKRHALVDTDGRGLVLEPHAIATGQPDFPVALRLQPLYPSSLKGALRDSSLAAIRLERAGGSLT